MKARKVFISFLGTSNYKPCEYVKDGISYGNTRFIQEATFRYLSKREDWSNDNNRILILLTNDAERLNWIDGGHQNEGGDSEGLQTKLSFFPITVDTLRNLPPGDNENEIWTIFESIFKYINEGDELYFDLTHGFRYLPMLSLVLSNYAKFLKNVSIRSVTYGNWETSNDGQRPARIIDLLPLSTLQDWTFAAGQFLESGVADRLVELSRREYTPILRETLGQDKQAIRLRNFVNSLQQLVEDARSCRGLSFIKGKSIQRLHSTYTQLDIPDLKPFAPIFEKVENDFASFSSQFDVLNGIRISNWCFKKGLYQQAATYLEESFLYLCTLSLGLDPINRDQREKVSGAIHYACSKHQADKKKHDIGSIDDETCRMGDKIDNLYAPLVSHFSQLRENIRNDYNHAGIRPDPRDGQRLKGGLGKVLSSFTSILLGEQESFDNESIPTFINYSNHPSGQWSQNQRQAASEYGVIIDRPFPGIEPDADPFSILSLVENEISFFQQNYSPMETTVHIMGEMTCTFQLVNRLKSLGYRCVASTTKREVHYNEKGEKVVRFDFVRFREY